MLPPGALVRCPQLLCTSFLPPSLSGPAPGRAALAFCEQSSLRGPKWTGGGEGNLGQRLCLGMVCWLGDRNLWVIQFRGRRKNKVSEAWPENPGECVCGGLLPARGANRTLASKLVQTLCLRGGWLAGWC